MGDQNDRRLNSSSRIKLLVYLPIQGRLRDSNMTAAQKAQMLNKPAQHIASGQPPHKRQKHDHGSTTLANSLPSPVHSYENKTASPEQLQLLLLLAEKYFAAAYAGHSWAGLEVSPQGLIATGLGCLEAVLKVYSTNNSSTLWRI